MIRVHDDGRGVDWGRVRSRALDLGLPVETEHDLHEALFADGVSTLEEASEYSGRGVGLGAIREACRLKGGMVRVTSRSGVGTTFEFTFPVETLAVDPKDMLAAA